MKPRGRLDCCCTKNAYLNGTYKRSSDGQVIRRYRCKTCGTSFSAATTSPLRWQKKRTINHPLMELLSNNVSLAAAARILRVNPKTVAKKLIFLGNTCAERLMETRTQYQSISSIQFDELMAIEHTK